MARRVKFALEMKDGFKARNNIEEIRNNFDYVKVVSYIANGDLQTWLEDRGYGQEAAEVSKLQADEADLKERICAILKMDINDVHNGESVMCESLRNRLEKVKQYTADKKILDNIAKVATNQDELLELVQSGESEIYLCAESFVIPLVVENVTYIGIANPTAIIRSSTPVDFVESNIVFRNVTFDDEYLKICEGEQKKTEAVTEGIYIDETDDSSRCDKAAIALEILACLINGETERGAFIWKSRSRIKWNYGFRNLDLDLSMLERDIYCRIRGWIDKYNERIILIIEDEYKGLFMAEGVLNNELLVLTDGALYYYGEGKQYRCGYCDLMDVTVPLAGTVLIDLQNGKRLHINKRRTVSEVGDESLRLFLLIMAKRFGDCRYEFTSDEKSILEKIELDNNGENRSSIYNFGTNKGCTECDDKKERENIWTKIAAELLGVIIHGELRNGQIIFAREGHKKETGKITYTALPVNEFAEVNIVPALKVHLSQYNNFVIGLVFEHGYRTFDQYLIFGDKAIYTQNSNLEWFSIRYEKINKVKVMNNSELVITMCDEKGWKFLPGSKLWKNKVGLNNFRLFLLIAARMLGDCKYEFTGEELKKLRKVKLDSLDGICILDCM